MLCYLRKNGRETLTTISRKTSIPISTLYDKLKSQAKSLISRHTCLIDFNQLGFNTRATISMKIAKEQRDGLRDFLSKHQNINNMYKINNGYDYMVEVVFRNVKELEEFIESMEEKFNLIDYKVYYIIDDIKREEFLSTLNHVSLVM